jgi:hypothetical protein
MKIPIGDTILFCKKSIVSPMGEPVFINKWNGSVFILGQSDDNYDDYGNRNYTN